jgi:O-antigen/teichoic acid export membrane protein
MIGNTWSLILMFGLTTGLSRGAALVSVPLLAGWLGLDDLGLFALVQTGAQIFLSLFSLNGATAILREGSTDRRAGLRIFGQFAAITLLIGGMATAVTFAVDDSRHHWWTVMVLLGLAEALQNLGTVWLRSRDANGWFVAAAVAKALSTLALVAGVGWWGWRLPELFAGLLLIGGTMAVLPLLGAVLCGLRVRSEPIAATVPVLIGLLAYTIPLIPHAVGQWVINGSGRFVVKAFDGDAAVGVFSLAATAGMVILLLNTGLGMVLPQEIVRHYEDWKTGPRRRKLIEVYSLAALVMLGLAFAALELDRRWLHLTGCSDPSLPLMVGLIGMGLYCQGLYTLYGNFYFYHRATGQLAVQTIAAAAINLALTLALVPVWGPLGAAVATLLTYLAYLGLLIVGLRKLEPQILSLVQQDAWLLAGPAMSMGLAGWMLMLCREWMPA